MQRAGLKMENLSERELLLLLNQKVDRLEEELAQYKINAERITALEMRIVAQEVKLRIWATVGGAAAGVLGSLLTKIVHLP